MEISPASRSASEQPIEGGQILLSRGGGSGWLGGHSRPDVAGACCGRVSSANGRGRVVLCALWVSPRPLRVQSTWGRRAPWISVAQSQVPQAAKARQPQHRVDRLLASGPPSWRSTQFLPSAVPARLPDRQAALPRPPLGQQMPECVPMVMASRCWVSQGAARNPRLNTKLISPVQMVPGAQVLSRVRPANPGRSHSPTGQPPAAVAGQPVLPVAGICQVCFRQSVWFPRWRPQWRGRRCAVDHVAHDLSAGP